MRIGDRARVLVLVSLLGCAGGARETAAVRPAAASPASAEPAASPPTPESTSTPLRVKLLDPGAAPRRAVRYAWKVGTVEYGEMDMRVGVVITTNGKRTLEAPMPMSRLVMRVEAKERTPSGDTKFTFEIVSSTVPPAAGDDERLRTALETVSARMVGARGRAVVSPRGIAREITSEAAPSSDAGASSEDPLREAIRASFVPVPEEEVGVGATWEIDLRVPAKGGAVMDVAATCKVVALDAERLQHTIVTKYSAPPDQVVHLPELPPTAHSVLVSVTGGGLAETSTPLVKLVPTGQAKTVTSMQFDIAAEGERLAMEMFSDIANASRPGKPPPPKEK